jgi:hypothetical protein
VNPTPSPTVPAGTVQGPLVGPPTATVTGVAPPVPEPPPAASSVTTALLSGAVIAAIITAMVTACVAVWAARRRSREEERARQRDLYASAFQAYAAYKEMPYAIRRRHDLPADERLRLSEITREIQERLSYFVAWTAAESVAVGDAYAALVNELRKIAGGAMRDAWLTAPITDDAAMNIAPTIIDLSSLTSLEKAYAAAVREHLTAIAPWWAR